MKDDNIRINSEDIAGGEASTEVSFPVSADKPGRKLFCIYGDAGEGLTSSGLGVFIVLLCAAVLGMIIYLAR